MDRAWQDVRFACRMLVKSPVFTTVAVLSLALGIGANTTIFTLVNAVFLNPLPVGKPSELVAVFTVDEKNGTTQLGSVLQVSHPNYKDFRDRNDSFTAMAAYSFPLPVAFASGGPPDQLFAEVVTGNYFEVLDVRPAAGRFIRPDEDAAPGAHPVVVLSYGVWQRRFGGDQDIVNRVVTVNGTAFTIVGVAGKGFRGVNSLFSPDLWIPGAMYAQVLPAQFRQWYDSRRALLFNVVARLKPGVSPGQALANLVTLARALEREYPEPNGGRSVTVMPIAEATIFPALRTALVLGGTVLMTIVGLVLLIACSNVANLLLARASSRRQEIAVRMALGAGRSRLVRQLVTESVLLALIAAALGLGVAWLGRDLIWSLRPAFLAQNFVDLAIDSRVLIFTAVIAVATGLLFGLAPALQASRADVVDALKEESRSAGRTRRRVRLGQALVVVQVALSLVALVTAGLFLRSLQSAHAINPGFDVDRLAVVTVNPGQSGYERGRRDELFRLIKERVRAIPGVRNAAWSTNTPLLGSFFRSIFIEGQEADRSKGGVLIVANTIGPDYFATTGIRVKQGREFTDGDREGTLRVAIVNETFAERFLPGQNPIGRRFRYFTDDFFHEIVGVVATSKYNTIGEAPQPAAFVPAAQQGADVMTLIVRADGDPAAALGTAQREIRAIDATVPVTVPFTMRQVLDNSLWAAQLGAILLGILGGLALTLAMIGLYGVMAYSVTQRRQEIGLRMALGAGQRTVLGLVLREGLTLVGVGLALGLAAAFGVSRLAATLLYGVSASDPVTFVGVSSLLLLVALVASAVPAIRASRVDPLVALRY